MSLLSVAASVAFSAASYFLRPRQNIERGKVSEIPVQQSTFGVMLERTWGTTRQAGNVIWTTGLRQSTESESAKGLGPKVTTYTYHTDLAVMICENEITDVLRIWADGKIIYDATDQSTGASGVVSYDEIIKEANDQLGSFVAKIIAKLITTPSGLTFRLYLGTDDQEPDPLIEADVDARYGAGSTPAYRGRAYVVFEDFNLTNFGNRIPNLSFEVVAKDDAGADVPTGQLIKVNSPTALAFSSTAQNLKMDPIRGRAYYSSTDATQRLELGVVDMDAMDVLLSVNRFPVDYVVKPKGNQGINERTGELWGVDDDFGAGADFRVDWYVVDKDVFTPNITATHIHDVRRVEVGGATASFVSGLVTYDAYVTISNNSASSRGVYIISNDGQTIVGDIVTGESIGGGVHYRSHVVGTGPDGRHAYCIMMADDPPNYQTLQLFAVGVETDDAGMAGFTDYGVAAGESVSIKAGVRDTFTPADFGGTAFTNREQQDIGYDRASQALLLFIEVDNQAKCAKWTRDSGITDVIDVPEVPSSAHASYISGYFAWCTDLVVGVSCKIALLNIATMELDSQLDGASASAQLNSTSLGSSQYNVWDAQRFALYGLGGTVPYKITLGLRSAAPVTLADILEDLNMTSGLEPVADIDVSEQIDTVVEGYSIGQQQSARSAIEPLSDVYFFDGVESDYKLRYKDRGRSVSDTIDQSDMLRADDGRDYVHTRVQETEIPSSVQVSYSDSDNDYQTGTQQAARVRYPYTTVLSENQQTIGTPISTTADVAKQAAEKRLFTAWNEREGYQFMTSWGFMLLDPTDVVNTTLDNGQTVRQRIDSLDVGADLSLDMRTVKESADQYLSTASGQTGAAIQVTPIIAKPVDLLLVDCPLIRDTDDTGSKLPLMYWAAGLNDVYTFPGAVLNESRDLTNYSAVGATSTGAAYGRLESTLSAPATFWTWDDNNTVDVSVISGESDFVSDTDLNVLNGANAVAIISSTGEVEIVQFATVTSLGSKRVRLSRLLRGRRGTESFGIDDHAIGELVVLLGTTTTRKYLDELVEVGQPHLYKCAAAGQVLADVVPVSQTPDGRSLRPYAPVSQTATLNGSDIDLTAVRRTRISGELMDGTGEVPLNEDSEEYKIEILDAPGGNVLRTITGISTPFYKYLAADIATDFGSTPTSIDLIWYQISAQVGDGFPGAATVEVM